MNKKFSTLVAGAMLATTVGTASAQVASKDAVKYETGKYYVLAGGAGGVATTADSVLSVTRFGDKYIYSLSSSRTKSLAEIDSALWQATITTKPGSSTPTFQFINKATGVPLSINPAQASQKGINAATAAATDSLVAGGSVTEWKHSPVLGKPERSTLSSALDGDSSVVLGVSTENRVVAYRAGNGEVNGAVAGGVNYSPLKLQVFAASPVYLNAADLNTMMYKVKDANAFKNGWFKLNYNPSLVGSVNEPNIFDQELQAVPAVTTLTDVDYKSDVTASDSVYLKVKGKTVNSKQAFAMLDTAYFNLNVPADTLGNKYRQFVYADTTGAVIGDRATKSLPQFAFKFQYFPSQDSIAIYTSSAAKRQIAKDASTYWRDGNASISLEDTVVSVATLVKGKHTEFTVGNAKDASGALSANGAGVKFSITQSTANIASIPTGYYYIKNLNADSPVLSDKKKGYYFTIGLDSTLTYLPDGNKAWKSAAQWYVNTASNYSTIANREFAPVGGVINAALASVPTGLFYKSADYSASNLVVTDLEGNLYKFEPIAAADLKKSAYLVEDVDLNPNLEKKYYAFKYFTGFDAVSAFVNIKEDSAMNVKESEKAEQFFELERVLYKSGDKAKELEVYTTIENADGKKIDELTRAAYKIKVKKDINTPLSSDQYVVLDGNTYKVSAASGGANAQAAVFFLKKTTKEDYFALIDTTVANSKTPKTSASKVVVSDATSSVNDLEYIALSGRTSSFALTVEDQPLYRRLGVTKADDGFTDGKTDTAKIYLTRNNERFLYENTKNNIAGKATGINYLGEYNDKQFDNAAALFIDTAYVRNETMMPQYMIALRPQFGKWIPCPEDDAHGSSYKYQVKADYLVNLADSTASSTRKNKEDLFKFETKNRLAFVPAVHDGRKLVIENSVFTGNKTQIKAGEATTVASKDTIDLSKNAWNYVSFQFRLVDNGADADFFIESCKENGTYEFIQLLNGVPVLTSNIEDAERFNIVSTKERPTDNEGITTTEVSVVAGAGSVTINNAAGKAVVISNILGQTIVNTVITSDNATISVPAGIVVVSVDGEAVKAIVK